MKNEENLFNISDFTTISREMYLFWDIFFDSILLMF